MNKVILIGNVGGELKLKNVGDTPVLQFSMATNESYKDKNGDKQDKTEWHTIVVWGNRAEGLNRILKSGHKVAIEGSIHTRTWESDKGKQYFTEVKAFNVELLERAPRQDTGDDNF